MGDSTFSFENSLSFEEDFDIDYLTSFGMNNNPNNNNNTLTSIPTFNRDNNNDKAIQNKTSQILKELFNLLNANITIYNANLNKYKELAVQLDKEMTLALIELVTAYLKTAKSLVQFISDDSNKMGNSVSKSLLSYIKSIFELYTTNLFSKIQRLQNYIARQEEAFKHIGWILIRCIWLVNHAGSYGQLPNRPITTDSEGFVGAISAGSYYISEVHKKIMHRFTNIDWLYGQNTTDINALLMGVME